MNSVNVGSPWIFSEGLAAVIIKNHWGYINRNGNVEIEPKFTDAAGFSEGLAYARIGDTHGYINNSGSFAFQKPVTKPTLIDKLRGRKDWLRW